MGDSPAPPTLSWSSLGQNSKRKVFGEKMGVGRVDLDSEGLSRVCWVCLQCSLGMHLDSVPDFLPALDPKLLP